MKADSFVVAELQQTPLEVGPRKGYPLRLFEPKAAVDAH
jgi:hypothetical protein